MNTAFHEELECMAEYAARENKAMRAKAGALHWDSVSKAKLQHAMAKSRIGRPTTTTDQVAEILRNADGPMSTPEIAKALGKSREAANSALHNLKRYGKANSTGQRGPRRTVYWVAI